MSKKELFKTNRFYDMTKEFLTDRLKKVKAGESVKLRDTRNLFYLIRKNYINATGDPTCDYTGKNLYKNWRDTVVAWCKRNAHELGFTKLTWFKLRDALNIMAGTKAKCFPSEGETFMIEMETRARTFEGCSFILACEKHTVSRELQQKLTKMGYKVNVVSMGGFSVADFQDVVNDVREQMERLPNDTFYILMLHDYDVTGISITAQLQRLFPNIIDAGITTSFLEYLKGTYADFDLNQMDEEKDQVSNTHEKRCREYMEQSSEYDISEFDYLLKMRVEIDSIHAQYDIKPFVEYISEKIQKICKYWDLRRIGVEDFELNEPKNHYEDRLKKLNDDIGKEYKAKYRELTEPKEEILKTVREVLGDYDQEFEELVKKNWTSYNLILYIGNTTGLSLGDLKSDEIDKLKKEHREQMKKEWVEDYDGELEDINDQIDSYEGDVRKGESDLENQRDDLQKELKDAKKNDPDLEPFQKQLNEVDYDKDEMSEIETRDEATLIQEVISTLQARLKEIEA